MKPEPYDIDNPASIARLHRELLGYMRVSLDDGTDRDGRQHALSALAALVSRAASPAPPPMETIADLAAFEAGDGRALGENADLTGKVMSWNVDVLDDGSDAIVTGVHVALSPPRSYKTFKMADRVAVVPLGGDDQTP